MLHAQDHAENVGVERRGKAFGGLIGDRADLALGGGVVHRDIETAKPCDGLVDQSADVIFLADVGVDELGLRPERAQFRCKRLAGLIAPTGNHHPRALLGEGDGSGPPDARESTSYKNNLGIHGPSPLFIRSRKASPLGITWWPLAASTKTSYAFAILHRYGTTMELRHLRYFVAVAEEGSLTHAAERRLHTAQPSLSRQIRDLEIEVGVKLLERGARGIELTAAGRTFLDHARLALLQVEAAGEAARRAAQPREGDVHDRLPDRPRDGLAAGRAPHPA